MDTLMITKPSIDQLLCSGEWNDVAFKFAKAALPKSGFETGSGFVNTHGSWIILGGKSEGEGLL